MKLSSLRRPVALLGVAAAFTPIPAGAQTQPLVEDMLQAVSKSRLTGHVQTLQDFQTRYTYAQGNTDAGVWLHDYFASHGVDVEYHVFSLGAGTESNVIARIPGKTQPDEIVAISGHFDSTSPVPSVSAPGADDDASGIAGVLEAAFVFKDYQFARTVEFMCFNAEEQGRRGSKAIAADYVAAGTNLVAVVNSDMIGYWPTGWSRDLDVAYEPVSEWLADHVVSVSNSYVGIPVSKHPSGACKDDHYSFTAAGLSAVTNMDCWEAHNGGGETTPYYHKATDTVSTLNLDCMTQVVQVNLAAVAELATPLALISSSSTLSESTGGGLDLSLAAGPTHAGRTYFVLGGMSGSSPGTPLPGNLATLPLNWDLFTNATLVLANTPSFAGFVGTLDGTGRGSARLDTLGPLNPGLIGLTLHFAYILSFPFDFASNPVGVLIAP